MKKKAPTIKEITKIVDVSPMMVSRARNNKPYVRFQAREKIAAIAKLTIDRDLKKALITIQNFSEGLYCRSKL